MIQKYSSNYVFYPGNGILRFGIIVVDNDIVIDIIDTGGQIKEIASLEFYSGLIVVGNITMQSFNSLRIEEASFADFFSNVTISKKSILHLENLDFFNKRLQSNTSVRKIL